MGYLNTSMTKRAYKETALMAALVGIPSAIGAAAGGVAGHYGSDKPNNTPATVLGTLGGGAGAAAGFGNSMQYNLGLGNDLNNIIVRSELLPKMKDYVQHINKNSIQTAPDFTNYLKDIAEMEKQLAETPKWMKYIAKHPNLRKALMLGTLGLGTAAGGALGAKLGIIGGDVLA